MVEETNNMRDITSLEDFQGWENSADEKDFFTEVITDETKPEVAEDEVEKPKEKEEKENKKKPEKKEEESLFKENVENEEKVDKKDEEEEEKIINPNIEAVKLLKEKGIIDFELEEGEELTEEKAAEIAENVEDNFDEAVDKRVEELFEDLPDFVKQLNKYAIKGGDLKQFLNTVTNSDNPAIKEDIDLDIESNQELVIREMLKKEDYDDEEVETQLEFLKESGKLEKFAEKKFNKWKANKKKEQEQLIQQQEAQARAEKEAIRKTKQKTSAFLSENENIGELEITKADIKTLPSYMNDKKVKLQNGASITQLQKELFYDIPQNEKAFMQLATLVKNRNEDGTFNFKSIMKKAKTKVAKEVKANIRRSKTSIPTKSKNKNQQLKRNLADFFN